MRDPTILKNYFEDLSYKEKSVIINGFADRLAENIGLIGSVKTPEDYTLYLAFIQQDKEQVKELVNMLTLKELDFFMCEVISSYIETPPTEQNEIKVDVFHDAVRNVDGIEYNQIFIQSFNTFCNRYGNHNNSQEDLPLTADFNQ